MANHGNDNLHSSIHVPGGQTQMRREDLLNQPSDIHNPSQGQATNLFQETGTQVKNMAQGAAGSAVNMARGAATGAAQMAQGAADAVKNTLGLNSPNNTTDSAGDNYLNQPGTINFDDDFPNCTTNIPGDSDYLDGLNYRPSNPRNPTNPRNPRGGI